MYCTDWPVDYSSCQDCAPLSELSAERKAVFEQMAAEYLWRWTNRQFGVCTSTIRPCKQTCTEGVSTYGPQTGSPWSPALVGGRWINLACGQGCGDECGCTSGRALIFEKPVTEVTAVVVDGVALDPSAYRLDNHRYLRRLDGQEWPYCQDMLLEPGEVGTWSVTVKTGTPVPAGGRLAAGKLACELAKAATGSGKCELPQRWQSITRQGVTISAALDSFEGLDEGKTGIWLIDSWVASITKPVADFAIASPDFRSRR